MGSLGLQDAFKIFRLKKYIENEVFQGGEDQTGIATLYKKKSSLMKLQVSLEELSVTFNDFWNNMLQTSPEFNKILKLGILMKRGIKKIQLHSQFLDYSISNDVKMLEKLAIFWYYVACDFKNSNEIIEK